jgi:hypothetical protein
MYARGNFPKEPPVLRVRIADPKVLSTQTRSEYFLYFLSYSSQFVSHEAVIVQHPRVQSRLGYEGFLHLARFHLQVPYGYTGDSVTMGRTYYSRDRIRAPSSRSTFIDVALWFRAQPARQDE